MTSHDKFEQSLKDRIAELENKYNRNNKAKELRQPVWRDCSLCKKEKVLHYSITKNGKWIRVCGVCFDNEGKDRFNKALQEAFMLGKNSTNEALSLYQKHKVETTKSFKTLLDEVEKLIAHNKKNFSIDRHGREYCALCMEEDYCEHEIKIEELQKVLAKLKEFGKSLGVEG